MGIFLRIGHSEEVLYLIFGAIWGILKVVAAWRLFCKSSNSVAFLRQAHDQGPECDWFGSPNDDWFGFGVSAVVPWELRSTNGLRLDENEDRREEGVNTEDSFQSSGVGRCCDFRTRVSGQPLRHSHSMLWQS